MKTAILSLQIALGLCAEAYASGKTSTAQYEKESTELKDAMNVIERADWTGKNECKSDVKAANGGANDKAEPEMQVTRAEAILGDIMSTRTQDPLHIVRCELHNTLIKAFDRVLSLETEFGVKSEAVGMYIEQMKAGIIQVNAAIIAAYPHIVQIRDMENGE